MRFYADKYIRLADLLQGLETELNAAEAENEVERNSSLLFDSENIERFAAILVSCRKGCAEIGLRVSEAHTDEIIERAQRRGAIDSEALRALRKNIERELRLRFFVGIAPERIQAFTNGRHGWDDIADRFPAAVDDIEEMNKCYALCRYSAAVFHSLVVVEHGLVALGPRIGATDPKEGWDASCRQLERVVKAGRAANATGFDFEQLDQLNMCVQAMKQSWRNKISHATGKPILLHGGFAPDVAEEIMATSRGFMRRLAIVLR